jgi:hypothetical protein
MKRLLLRCVVALALFALRTTAANADFITYNVTLDTSGLAANFPGQALFAVDFQLNDGSGAGGDGNNTATITNFSVDGGHLSELNPGGTPPGSDVSGILSSTLTITDAGSLGGFNDYNQAFVPGSILSFNVELSTNVSSSEQTTPDEFSFAVYSNNFGSLASLLTIDITSPNPTVTTSGGLLGNGFQVPPPDVSAVPEPTSLSLFGLGLGALAIGGCRRRRKPAALPADSGEFLEPVALQATCAENGVDRLGFLPC